MAPILARSALIKASTTSGGTYTTIAQVHQFTDRRGQSGGTENFVFGSNTPITDASSDDSTLDINFLLDLTDTNGQNIILAAFEAGTTLFLHILYNGTAGRAQEMKVTSYQATGDANGTGLGKYVAGTATFTAAGASTSI